MEKGYYVYLLASGARGYLYVGITNDIVRRLLEHEQGFSAYTANRNIKRLVYCEVFTNPAEAIAREKQLKRYKRDYKFNLVESQNPEWQNLANKILGR